MTLAVEMLRRYPVKAIGGESCPSLRLDGRGVEGDRWYAVTEADGRLATFKTSGRFRRRDELAEFRSGTDASGTWVAHGERTWRVGDAELDRFLTETLGADVRVAPEGETPHVDAGAVSLVGTATLDWCREHLDVDADPRRLRPNLVVRTEEAFEEEAWSGEVQVGDVVLRAVEKIVRCRTIDLAQDGVATTTPWLKGLGKGRDLSAGIYLDVVSPGEVHVGDDVRPGER